MNAWRASDARMGAWRIRVVRRAFAAPYYHATMGTNRTPFIGGNWKMNLNGVAAKALVQELIQALAPHCNSPSSSQSRSVEIAVFPPYPYLSTVVSGLRGIDIAVGGQDCSPAEKGAFTGQVSAGILRDIGCTMCIIGHSERRHGLHESDALVGEKVTAALAAGLGVVLCVGETRSEREAGQAHMVNARQLRAALAGVNGPSLSKVVIAYEPVWAIGTGLSATPDDAQEAHHEIRKQLRSLYDAELSESVRIVYGGSLNAANAQILCALPDVDGGLVGGASLKAADFETVCAAAAARTGLGIPRGG